MWAKNDPAWVDEVEIRPGDPGTYHPINGRRIAARYPAQNILYACRTSESRHVTSFQVESRKAVKQVVPAEGAEVCGNVIVRPRKRTLGPKFPVQDHLSGSGG